MLEQVTFVIPDMSNIIHRGNKCESFSVVDIDSGRKVVRILDVLLTIRPHFEQQCWRSGRGRLSVYCTTVPMYPIYMEVMLAFQVSVPTV